jgi:hypothetical protein
MSRRFAIANILAIKATQQQPFRQRLRQSKQKPAGIEDMRL